tara:strand:+ start:78 stop:518 length:441 start_codon:yes stop_codon:yes gene_type:complete
MNVWKFLSTCAYIGYLPYAPGSWCSIIFLLIWFYAPLNTTIQFLIILFFFVIGIISSKKTSLLLSRKDPSEIVIDEALGILISLFMLPKNIILCLIALFIFRLLDIFKPSIIYSIQNIPGGLGIILDDVIAGIITCIICHGLTSIL